MPDKFDLLNAEFAAVKNIRDDYRRLSMTAIVDDDYPQMRHNYESGVRELVKALKENRPEFFTVMPDHGEDSIGRISHINLERCKRWHEAGLDSWSLSDWAVAFAGEVGEACDVIKKLNRVRDRMPGNKVSETQLRADLGKELADSFLYLLLLAARARINLFFEVRDKFNEVSERLKFPERL